MGRLSRNPPRARILDLVTEKWLFQADFLSRNTYRVVAVYLVTGKDLADSHNKINGSDHCPVEPVSARASCI
jgi:hypothetical protein